MHASHFRLAVVLGFLALAGPFAIDMYLPALPQMAVDLGVSESAAQVTLLAFFIPFGMAQIVYGPWADQVGRKTPIYFGLTLFGIASVGAASAQTLDQLIVWRGIQGAGAAVSMVIPRAVIRDVETGPAATRLMATIMLVISISPMIAPLAGSGIISIAGWRAIFGVVAVAAVLCASLAYFTLEETLPVERRVKVNFANMKSGIIRLSTHGTFMGLTLTGSFGTASFFVFLSSAPFVYTGQYGLSPTGFSLAFAVNAIGFFSASQFAGPLSDRLGMKNVVLLGGSIFSMMLICLLLVVLSGVPPLSLLVAMLFVGNAGLGLVIPTVMVLALDEHGEIAGLASSFGGTIQMTLGGVAIALSGLVFDGTVVPMISSMAVCAVAGLTVSFVTLRRVGKPRQQVG